LTDEFLYFFLYYFFVALFAMPFYCHLESFTFNVKVIQSPNFILLESLKERLVNIFQDSINHNFCFFLVFSDIIIVLLASLVDEFVIDLLFFIANRMSLIVTECSEKAIFD